jgi:signal transduction histidine kinase
MMLNIRWPNLRDSARLEIWGDKESRVAVMNKTQSLGSGTFSAAEGAALAHLLEVRLGWTRGVSRADVYVLCFAIPATLIAVYATVLAGESHTWRTATLCWALALVVLGLIAGIRWMVERCEREASQNGGFPTLTPAQQSTVEPLRAVSGAHKRVVHLEQVIVRQHRFVSDVAHELRTPLTAQCVVGESLLARQGVTSAELREGIASILEESKHMKRLIEGLLDLTRAALTNAAEQEVSREAVALDLSVLARDCVESLRVLAEEKQQSIEVSTPAEVFADVDLTIVRQALLNVIHNSIEHCPEGTQIHVETKRRSPKEALIRVQDNGPGIPLQEQRYVFERFYRGAGTSRRRSLGLGLSIARAILATQGGGIGLESTPGEGCCFLLTLPLAVQPYR